jgi:hypothetical protein
MAGCPNCGRRTMRTKDWVCQWCGYPLLYGGYKQIDKTFKELQEERNSSWKSVKPEPEPEFDFETEPEPEPLPEPPWKMKRPPQPERRPEPEPEAEIKPEPPPGPPAAPQPRPELAPPPQPELLPRPETEPIPLPEAEIAPEEETAPRPEPAAPPRQEIPSEPLTVPSLDSIKDGTELTIDQIDALFRADGVGANAALKDRTVIIKGTVNKVFIRDHLDIRYMILTGTRKGIWSVRCGFGKESSPQMSHLTEGQAITLRGRYDGFSKNIIFKDCTLVG